jgi:hypothetical protein
MANANGHEKTLQVKQRFPAPATAMTRYKANCPIPELEQRRLPAMFESNPGSPPAQLENPLWIQKAAAFISVHPHLLWQSVVRSYRGAQRASWSRTHTGVIVSAASRTRRYAASRVQLDVGRQVGRIADSVPGGFTLFERPLLGGIVNPTQVVDTGIGLRGGTSLHKVGNRDGRQQADNGHDDHDFHQCEARLTEVLDRFHSFAFYLCGGTQRQADYDNDNLVPVLPDATAMFQTAATLQPNAKNACMASAN